ncbi:DNA topoisomerase VI subunit B [Nanoarchaeota archaeon]
MAESKAQEMAKQHREISVAEFFEKNRHLLGFDNPKKALLTAVKEAVDNSLDACEEANMLPEIQVQLIDMGNDRFRMIVEDNGPGIVKKHIPKVFAKLLYGSKFHRFKQGRGQQGIGISASVMYAQLTTGRATKIWSKTSPGKLAHYYELKIDTRKNEPHIMVDDEKEWEKDTGIRIEMDLEGGYSKGGQSVDEYLKQTSIVNPHVTLIYTNPKAEQIIFPRVTDQMPKQPKEIKPHPYGVELGMLIKMLHFTKAKTLSQFFQTEFSRVGAGTAKQVCENALINPKSKPRAISRADAEKLIQGIKDTKIISPPTDCISPIGEGLLEKGLRKEVNAEFYCSVTRAPNVYRGNPFQIEVAIAYGGDQTGDKQVKLLRYANKVPLLYQQGACAFSKTMGQVNWRPYGLQQSGANLPVGPATVVIHMASVWVPFTSESKEAVAHYPEIIEEVRLALQEAGRKLKMYTKKKRRVSDELKKRSFIQKYIPHVSLGLKQLLGLQEVQRDEINEKLESLLEQQRGEVEELDFDPDANEEFDEEFAKIGKEEEDVGSD